MKVKLEDDGEDNSELIEEMPDIFLVFLRRQQSTTQSRRYSVHCFSILRVHCDESKCVHCGKCLRVCPMNVEVNKESRKRKRGTECILCYECTKVCPTKALH